MVLTMSIPVVLCDVAQGETLDRPIPRLRRLDRAVHILLTAILAVGRKRHVLLELTRNPRPKQVEPLPFATQGELVGIAQPRGPSIVPSGVEPGMMPRELFPASAEDPHDPSPQLDMRFAFRAVHVRLAQIAPVMDDKRNPEPGISRESVQPPPSDEDQKRMDKDVMCSEQEAFRTYFHNLQNLITTT